jgi:hypothetical protein
MAPGSRSTPVLTGTTSNTGRTFSSSGPCSGGTYCVARNRAEGVARVFGDRNLLNEARSTLMPDCHTKRGKFVVLKHNLLSQHDIADRDILRR